MYEVIVCARSLACSCPSEKVRRLLRAGAQVNAMPSGGECSTVVRSYGPRFSHHLERRTRERNTRMVFWRDYVARVGISLVSRVISLGVEAQQPRGDE